MLADRTQAPSGAGYTLENRIVLSRSLPEAFRDCQVERLASFFWAQRDTLTALSSLLAGKVVVSVVVPLQFGKGGPHAVRVAEGSAAEEAS